MALRHYVDGVERTARIRNPSPNAPGGGMVGLTSSAQGGAFGSGGLIVDDWDGTLDLKGWRPYYAEEDTATPSRVFTGFIGGRRIEQADLFEAPGVARVWDCDLMDLNVVLGLRCFRNEKRPIETDLVRIAYLLANWPDPDYPVFDNGGVDSVPPNNYDESDWDGKFPEEVLSEMTLDARMFYLYWDETALAGQEISLFWNRPTSARGDATVTLSNDPADINGTTCFAAEDGQQVLRDPAFTYSGVYIRTKAGKLYREEETTATTYIRRDMVYDTDRIGNATTMSRRADQLLDRSSTERDTLTCSVLMDDEDVNLIREGFRIQVKFTHLSGYASFTWVTIQRRTFRRPDNGSVDKYVLDLEMSNFAPTGTGEGGSPSDFPLPDPTPPGYVQHKYAVGTSASVTLDAAPTQGNLLVCWMTQRGNPAVSATPPSGWTAHPGGTVDPDGVHGRMIYRVVGAGESATVTVKDSSETGAIEGTTLVEFSGVNVVADADSEQENSVVTGSSPATVNAGTITPTAGQSVLLVEGLCVACSDYPSDVHSSITPTTGWTELTDTMQDNGSGANLKPLHWFGYRIVTLTSGSYSTAQTLSPTSYNYAGDSGQALAFGASSGAAAPASGQWVFGEVASMAGAVGTLDYGYAAGSLRIRVDGVLISPASYTETDPAAGTFTLSWTPDTDETVTCDYQGN